MSTIEDDLMKGFTEHADTFDKWCDKASLILGKVTQCGIWETDSTGHGFLVTNRPDYGETYLRDKSYLLDHFHSYVVNFEDAKLEMNTTGSPVEGEGYFDLNMECPYLDIGYAISYKERVDQNTIRTYGFASDTPRIHDALVNNLAVFKKFLHHFKLENAKSINFIKDRKIDFSSVKKDFFIRNNYAELSDREKINTFLTATGILKHGKKITHREWQCAMLYARGKSASQTGEILGISRRTVETYFESMKLKLEVKTKSDILDTVN